MIKDIPNKIVLLTALLIILISIIVASAKYGTTPNYSNDVIRKTLPSNKNKPDSDIICAQVITPARNPETGEFKDFPTPCDVPADWEIIPTL